mmetsp:Transcript_19421/g.27916  ORF Transcript_19421/g.27916 Transcript_19421/m.27916 type:complete len:152 (+) Transcript_19421:29-484(+)
MGRFCNWTLLGEGSYGSVHRAYDLIQRRYVAVKTFKPSEYDDSGEVTVTTMREISILNSLSFHENVCQLIFVHHQQKSTENSVQLIFELEDMDLEDWVIKLKGRRVSLVDCKYITYQILVGTNHLHNHRIMHRDLKPDNILVQDKSKTVSN